MAPTGDLSRPGEPWPRALDLQLSAWVLYLAPPSAAGFDGRNWKPTRWVRKASRLCAAMVCPCHHGVHRLAGAGPEAGTRRHVLNPVSKNRLILIGIALMFFMPLLAAVLMQSNMVELQAGKHHQSRHVAGSTRAPDANAPDGAARGTAHRPLQRLDIAVPPGWRLRSGLYRSGHRAAQIHRAAGRHQQDLSDRAAEPRAAGR